MQKGGRSFASFGYIAISVFVLAVFVAVLNSSSNTGIFLGPDDSSKVRLPSGELADVQMGDEIALLARYPDNEKRELAPGEKLPLSTPWYGPAIRLRKRAGVGIYSLAPAKWNTNHQYTLRWLKSGGEAFGFNGPTDVKIVNERYMLIGSWTQWGPVALTPGKCGTKSTLVGQLIFQNKNKNAKTYGQEYILKEVTREIETQTCAA